MALELKALTGLLSRELNSIEDLPEYKTPPAGKYRLQLSKIEEKEVNESPALIFTWKVIGTFSLVDPETPKEDLMKEGDLFTEMFLFHDQQYFELTLGGLKKKVAPLAEYAGSTDLVEILNKIVDVTVDATITNRLDKKQSPPKIYASTKDIKLATA